MPDNSISDSHRQSLEYEVSRKLTLFQRVNQHLNVCVWKVVNQSFSGTVITPVCTLYNVCAVPWGWSVPWGCSVPWGISWVLWRVFSTVGDSWVPWGLSWGPWEMFSTVGDIMMHVGDVMSTMGGVQYHGGIPSFEIWVPWGISWYMWEDIMSTLGGVQYRGVLK